MRRCKSAKEIIVLTHEEYAYNVRKQVGEVDILLEPACRNTAPALALAMKYLIDVKKVALNETIFVAPSDHLISPEEHFDAYLEQADQLARQGKIVTFGIAPKGPATGFGYVHAKEGHFIEKPSLEKAQELVQNGNYFWNSGMFAFTIETMLSELQQHAPEIVKLLDGSFEEAKGRFSLMPSISIDYAVMEKSERAVVLPLDLFWSDVGSWDNIYEMLPKDVKQNAILGEVLAIDTANSLILGEKRLIATIGLQDMLVIETPDVILIARRQESQKVKEVVQALKGRKELSEHVTTVRPWGSYTVLEQGERYKIKKIVVNPGETLSLQKHFHRSEHWVVVKGTALVRIEDKETQVHENESIYVPKGAIHRISNPGKVVLEIIETQVGEYLGEDDITRFDDVYGRVP